MAPVSRLLNWRAFLLYIHRWLGIAGCLLFAAWFFSGVVMMYARMPELAEEERLARADALDMSAATLSPAEAAGLADAPVSSVMVEMVRGRPAYRFGGRARSGRPGPTVFADTGEIAPAATRAEAEAAARRFEPAYQGPLDYDVYLEQPDQWTLQARAQMPMHRFALRDAAATRLYVSEATGEVVLRTTRRERFWGYLGPVIHWVYFTPLRRNGPLWSQVIIWSSLAGCLMCATGLVWGLLRFSPWARYRVRGQSARSPYTGWMTWHHWAGLLFGVVTLTWTYSGLLSMGPFGWFAPRGRTATSGRVDSPGPEVSLGQLRTALATLSGESAVKRLQLMSVDGRFYWMAERAPLLSEADAWRSPSLLPRARRPRLARRYLAADLSGEPFARFSEAALQQTARTVMSGVDVLDETWLTAYDSYYYDARGASNLPVLRVRFADPEDTWVYLDPGAGGVVRRVERTTRLERWLYQGLHSLDAPFLYFRRPLWDGTVILLSLGGFVLSLTTIVPAWRRLLGHGRRLWRLVAR